MQVPCNIKYMPRNAKQMPNTCQVNISKIWENAVQLLTATQESVEGSGVAAETQILSRFLLMTPSLLFTSSGSFLVFQFIMFVPYPDAVWTVLPC